MKKKIIISTLFLGLLNFSQVSQAQEMITVPSTQELLNVCKYPMGTEAHSYCTGYITAIYDTYLVTRHPKLAKPFICMKHPSPTRDQVISEFVSWAEKNAQFATAPAADSTLRFLAGLFPCETQ